ncbi:hypothetical protein L0F63_003207, partial [Massospora cicadina]
MFGRTIEDASLIYIWEEFLVHCQRHSMFFSLKKVLTDHRLFAEFCALAVTRLAKPNLKVRTTPKSILPPEASVDLALAIQRQNQSKEDQLSSLRQTSTDGYQTSELISEGVSVPFFICRFLKPHQIEGVPHSMGLGKTFQVVVFICSLIQISRTAPATLPRQLQEPSILILCPVSVRANWQLEFKKWIPASYLVDFSISVIGETDRLHQKALEIRRWYSSGGILILNYETWRNLSETKELLDDEESGFGLSMQECLLDPGPGLVICDEGHIIKNPSSKISTLVKRIATPSKVCLTGYPIQNNLMEYWCMVDFVYPGYLGPEASFDEFFCKPITNALYYDCNIAQLRLYILTTVLESIVARKDMSILNSSLPPKIEIAISCKLSPLQAELYKDCLKLFSTNAPKLDMVRLLYGLIFVEKINRRPSDLPPDLANLEGGLPSTYDPKMQELVKSHGLDGLSIQDTSLSSKFQVLTFIMKETVKRKEKMLIFTRSLAVLDLIDNYIQCNPDLGFVHFRLDGNVSAQDRQVMIEAFNEDLTHNIFTISTMAGSLGINLISASRVVLYDVDWNPSHSDQAIARVFRFGQVKRTFVYRLYTHSTFEEALIRLSAAKSALFSRVVDQIDAPNNHIKIHKRYFKAPESAPPFEGAPGIDDEIAIAVSKACAEILCKMELLERDYDAIEFGISDEIKTKAKETILIGHHMGRIQTSPPSALPHRPALARREISRHAPSVANPTESTSQVEHLSPPKRHKSHDKSLMEAPQSPDYAEAIDLVSPDVERVIYSSPIPGTSGCDPTIVVDESAPISIEEGHVPLDGEKVLVRMDVEAGGCSKTFEARGLVSKDDEDIKPTPVNSIGVTSDQLVTLNPSEKASIERCASQPSPAYTVSSLDEKPDSPQMALPALKPIQICTRRGLVPPRNQPAVIAPGQKTHKIPQVEKGTRSPKAQAAEASVKARKSPSVQPLRPQASISSRGHQKSLPVTKLKKPLRTKDQIKSKSQNRIVSEFQSAGTKNRQITAPPLVNDKSARTKNKQPTVPSRVEKKLTPKSSANRDGQKAHSIPESSTQHVSSRDNVPLNGFGRSGGIEDFSKNQRNFVSNKRKRE